MPACLMSSALTTFARRFANQTATVAPLKFAKVSNVYQDVDQIPTVHPAKLAKTTSASILAPLPSVASMLFASLKATSLSAVVLLE